MKIQKYNKTVSPFAGISFVNHSFNKVGLSQLIDTELGARVKTLGYSYSDIFRNLTNVFLSGGSVIEDINSHLREHLKDIPNNAVPSAETVLRGLKELTTNNTVYKDEIAPTTRIKAFVFRFITVAGKWVYTGRRWLLKLYTKKPYEELLI